MIVGFRAYANNLFEVEHILVNAGFYFDRAATRASAFLFTEASFIDRLIRREVPPNIPIFLCSSKTFLPPGVDKIVSDFKPDYTVYIFDTQIVLPKHGQRLLVDLRHNKEQWILD